VDNLCPMKMVKNRMSIKIERINKIKSFLRIQSSAVSVTEIYEALLKRMHLKVSRKTIERDMVEMTDLKLVSVVIGVPTRFTLNKPTEIELCLKVEEIQFILKQIEPGSEIYLKLRKFVE
jgi:DeoR/GlpR family transcriptional regulator of sugar metabolism